MRRDTKLDDEVRPLVEYAQDRYNEWVPFAVLDDAQFEKTLQWLLRGKTSPVQASFQTTYDLQWRVQGGTWGKQFEPAVYRKGLRVGRIRLRDKKQYKRSKDA